MNSKKIVMILLLGAMTVIKGEERRSLLTDDSRKMLDVQNEQALKCLRKLRMLIQPLIEEFMLENYHTVEQIKQNTSPTLTDDEVTLLDAQVTQFCEKNLEKIVAFALEAYEISPNTLDGEGFIYSFEKQNARYTI